MEKESDHKTTKENIAVALSYDREKDSAPKVVSTGKGHIAAQIIAIAQEHNIEVHKDAELAKVLSLLDLDSIIPVEAYAAVAEILSYIYRTNANLRRTKDQ